MKNQDYQTSFKIVSSPEEAFKKISNIQAWWSKHFEGNSTNVGDVFSVRFGKDGLGDMYKMEVTEVIPAKKIVWNVIDSKQDWVEKTNEWTGTGIIWDIVPENGGTKIILTHKGLTSKLECYKTCEGGWNWLISESLSKLLQENMGKPV